MSGTTSAPGSVLSSGAGGAGGGSSRFCTSARALEEGDIRPIVAKENRPAAGTELTKLMTLNPLKINLGFSLWKSQNNSSKIPTT